MKALPSQAPATLAEFASAHLTPAAARRREELLRQVLPLWGRSLPDATVAVVVGLTAEISDANFASALLDTARTADRLSWDNPIPMLLAADRRMRADAVEAAEAAKREQAREQSVPMPAEVKAKLAKLADRGPQ